MKHLKKIMSLILTAIMVIAMCVPVMADNANGYTITAPANGHTYEVYQIFTGTLTTEGTDDVLSNIKWGKNGTGAEGTDVSETILNELKAKKNATDSEKLEVIKKYVDLTDANNKYGSVTSENPLNNVPAGYYLIKDVDGSQTGKEDSSYTTYLVSVVGSVEITPKADKPSSEKKVKDVNDSNGTPVTDWQDSADYDIGDHVPFQLKGTVASNYDSYKKYKFVFHDKESAGLTFEPGTVKVYVNCINITSGFTTETNPTDGDTFDVVFDDLKTILDPNDTTGNTKLVGAGSVITVEYTSILNDNAVVGSAGNPNTMHLEYSNNPNDAQGGETGKTPDDTVIVFTYKTVVNKTNEAGAPLAGAEFKLEKFVKDDKGTITYKNVKGKWVEKTLSSNQDGTVFTSTGLDDGYYRLTETKAPDHYNQLKEAIYFEITATHDILSDSPSLTAFNGSDISTGETAKFTFTAKKTEGSISTSVINKKGSTLPETGGIGTTIFYVVGVVLMLGAGVLLITKRRMSAKH